MGNRVVIVEAVEPLQLGGMFDLVCISIAGRVGFPRHFLTLGPLGSVWCSVALEELLKVFLSFSLAILEQLLDLVPI